MKRIILASGSPRRRELLMQVKLDFDIMISEKEEKITRSEPQDVVMELSRQKAEDICTKAGTAETVIIGADTVVSLDGMILGKPKNKEDAKRMLMLLQGRTHQVFTGVTVIDADGEGAVYTFYVCTDVVMYPQTEETINWYVSTGEPLDKAGAYGIQGIGAVLVERICGDYNNVVGLPLSGLWKVLCEDIGIFRE